MFIDKYFWIILVALVFVFMTLIESVYSVDLRLEVFGTLVGFSLLSRQIEITKESESKKNLEEMLEKKKAQIYKLHDRYMNKISCIEYSFDVDGHTKTINGESVIKFLNTIFMYRCGEHNINQGLPMHEYEKRSAFQKTSDYFYEIESKKSYQTPEYQLGSVEKPDQLYENYRSLYECSGFLDIEIIGQLYDAIQCLEKEYNCKASELSPRVSQTFSVYFTRHEKFLFEIRKAALSYRGARKDLSTMPDPDSG